MNIATKAGVLFTASFLQGVCLVLFPAASFIWKAQEIGALSDQQYGLLFFPMVTMAILTSVSLKKQLEKISRAKVYSIGLLFDIVYLLALLPVSLTNANASLNFGILIVANLFLGAGFGCLISILNILIIDYFPKKRDAALTGLHGFLGIGAATAPLVVNFFYQQDSWTLAVMLPIVLIVLVLAASSFFKVAQATEQTVGGITPGKAASESGRMALGAKAFLLVVVLYGVVEGTIGNWTISYLNEERNFSIAVASQALSAFWLAMTVGRILAAIMTTKIKATVLYRISPFMIIAGLLAILFMSTENTVIAIYFAVGLGCSYFFPLSVSLSTQSNESLKETLSSFMVAALMLGYGLGSPLVGFMKNQGWIHLSHAFSFATFLACVFGALAFSLTSTGQLRKSKQ